eukprot:2784924-Prymnesium_polylepis.1
MPRASSTVSATSLRAACCTAPSRAGGVASHSCLNSLLELATAPDACSAGRLDAAFDVPGAPPAASVEAGGAAVAAKGGGESSSPSSSEQLSS